MNKDQTKKAITERLLMICDEVIEAGLCATKREFAEKIGEHPQNLTLMAKGTRAPTLEQVASACSIFEYSPTWLILNVGPKKLSASSAGEVEERLSAVELEIEKLKRHLIKKIATGT